MANPTNPAGIKGCPRGVQGDFGTLGLLDKHSHRLRIPVGCTNIRNPTSDLFPCLSPSSPLSLLLFPFFFNLKVVK